MSKFLCAAFVLLCVLCCCRPIYHTRTTTAVQQFYHLILEVTRLLSGTAAVEQSIILHRQQQYVVLYFFTGMYICIIYISRLTAVHGCSNRGRTAGGSQHRSEFVFLLGHFHRAVLASRVCREKGSIQSSSLCLPRRLYSINRILEVHYF